MTVLKNVFVELLMLFKFENTYLFRNNFMSNTPWLSGIMNDLKAIFKAFVSSNQSVNIRIYSCVTHRLTSAWIQKSTTPLVP